MTKHGKKNPFRVSINNVDKKFGQDPPHRMGAPLRLPSRERWHIVHDTGESSDFRLAGRTINVMFQSGV